MTNKRKHGDRMPSSRLSHLVNSLNDKEFDEVLEILNRNGRQAGFKKLIAWHRGKIPYISDNEKKDFVTYDLNSLRGVAIKAISKAIKEIRLGIPISIQYYIKIQETERKLNPTEFKIVFGLFETQKQLANDRGYFQKTLHLCEAEMKLYHKFEPAQRNTQKVQQLENEVNLARRNIALIQEIKNYEEILTNLKSGLARTGKLDDTVANRYFNSTLKEIELIELPPLIQIKKLSIDESFAYLKGNVQDAVQFAERILKLTNSNRLALLSPLEQTKLLRRVILYHCGLRNKKKANRAIRSFRAFQALNIKNKGFQLRKYLISIIFYGFEFEEKRYFEEIEQLFSENREFIMSHSEDADYLLLLICLVTYFLGRQETIEAKAIFDKIYQTKDSKPRLLYRIQYMICHLMILFEENDSIGLFHFSRNYDRFFRSNLPFAKPALEISKFLRKSSKEVAPTSYEKLVDKLRELSQTKEYRNALWFDPILNWLRQFDPTNRRG